jgi:hypothetical protein
MVERPQIALKARKPLALKLDQIEPDVACCPVNERRCETLTAAISAKWGAQGTYGVDVRHDGSVTERPMPQ